MLTGKNGTLNIRKTPRINKANYTIQNKSILKNYNIKQTLYFQVLKCRIPLLSKSLIESSHLKTKIHNFFKHFPSNSATTLFQSYCL